MGSFLKQILKAHTQKKTCPNIAMQACLMQR